LSGTATLSGDVDVTTLSANNTVANVAFTGNGSSVTNAVAFANDGTLILGTSGGTQTYNGGLNTASVDGTVTLNGTIASSNDVIALGAVTLGSAVTIDTNAGSTTGDIAVGAITGGSNNLTLSTGNNINAADIDVSGAISGLGNLTLADVGGTADFNNNVAAAALSANNTVANIIFTGSTNTFSAASTLANDGALKVLVLPVKIILATVLFALKAAAATLLLKSAVPPTSAKVKLPNPLIAPLTSISAALILLPVESVKLLEPPVMAPTAISPVVLPALVSIVTALPSVTAPKAMTSLDDAMVPLRVTVPSTLAVFKPPL
jgi:hypothetical protein